MDEVIYRYVCVITYLPLLALRYAFHAMRSHFTTDKASEEFLLRKGMGSHPFINLIFK